MATEADARFVTYSFILPCIFSLVFVFDVSYSLFFFQCQHLVQCLGISSAAWAEAFTQSSFHLQVSYSFCLIGLNSNARPTVYFWFSFWFALRQVTEITGLTKFGSGIGFVDDFKNMETEPCEVSIQHRLLQYSSVSHLCSTCAAFWGFIREHLNQHDLQRYSMLKGIWTDEGRGRAWLRSTLNEHSLEKYMHMLVNSPDRQK